MSFPASPTVGATTVTNNITYIYNTGTNGVGYWTRQATTIIPSSGGGGGTAASGTGTTTTFVITNVTQSTSTNTGALVVAGGVGIWGNLNVGGAIVGGGVRSITTTTAPTLATTGYAPTVGDIWYQQGTDVVYRYENDGSTTTSYWIDITSPPFILQTTSTYVNITLNRAYGLSIVYGGY
jgi:hypothetical protein